MNFIKQLNTTPRELLNCDFDIPKYTKKEKLMYGCGLVSGVLPIQYSALELIASSGKYISGFSNTFCYSLANVFAYDFIASTVLSEVVKWNAGLHKPTQASVISSLTGLAIRSGFLYSTYSPWNSMQDVSIYNPGRYFVNYGKMQCAFACFDAAAFITEEIVKHTLSSENQLTSLIDRVKIHINTKYLAAKIFFK